VSDGVAAAAAAAAAARARAHVWPPERVPKSRVFFFLAQGFYYTSEALKARVTKSLDMMNVFRYACFEKPAIYDLATRMMVCAARAGLLSVFRRR
jgi:hypothetical protein